MPSNLQQFKETALADPGVRTAYYELYDEFRALDEVLESNSAKAQILGVDRVTSEFVLPPRV